MSDPMQTCTTCGRRQEVTPDGRGFPPDIAKRKLARACKAAGCPSTQVYRAGVSPELERLLEAARKDATS